MILGFGFDFGFLVFGLEVLDSFFLFCLSRTAVHIVGPFFAFFSVHVAIAGLIVGPYIC